MSSITITGAKRKASEFRDELHERPTLTKKRTSTFGGGGDTHSRSEDFGGFLPNAPINDKRSEGFQSKLTEFCERHGSTFGTAYAADLQRFHSQVISSSESANVLTVGQKFIEAMNSYIQDLQHMAVQQVQLRAHVVRLGVEKDTTAAMDTVLMQLDRRIVEMGAEMSVLWQELLLLEGPQEDPYGAAGVQQNAFAREIVSF